MDVALFAGLPVRDLGDAQRWYERLLGSPPTFSPNDTEAVWELAEGRSIYLEVLPDRAGRSLVTLFLEDYDRWVDDAHQRGLDPEERETYDNGVRKAIYRDPDGNEIGIGGGPATDA